MRKYQRLILLFTVAVLLSLLTGNIPLQGDTYTVYFESDRDGDSKIYRIGMSEPVAVTEDGCRHPSVTADNQMLVYTRIEETNWGRFWNVFYVVNGNERRLSTNEIYDEMEPVISRDGTFTAYTAMRAGNLEIITLSFDRNDLQYRITENGKPDESPTLASGDDWVYWTGRTGNYSYIFRAPGLGGRAERLSGEGIIWEEHPSVSADGRYMVFTAITPEESPITEDDDDSEEEEKSRNPKYPEYADQPQPEEQFGDEDDDDDTDGTQAEVTYEPLEGNSDIWVLDFTTGERTRLMNDSAWDGNPCISADGQKIVFTSDRDGNYEIYMINRDGTGLNRLTNNDATDDFATIT